MNDVDVSGTVSATVEMAWTFMPVLLKIDDGVMLVKSTLAILMVLSHAKVVSHVSVLVVGKHAG